MEGVELLVQFHLVFLLRLNFSVKLFLLIIISLVSIGYDDKNSNTLAFSPSHALAASPAIAVNSEANKRSGSNSSIPVAPPSRHSAELKSFLPTHSPRFLFRFLPLFDYAFYLLRLSQPVGTP